MSTGIGAAIRRHREACGWSQERPARELCRAAGVQGAPVGRQEVSRWERGRRTPREWLPSLAAVLDVPAGELVASRAPAGEPSAPADHRRDDYARAVRQEAGVKAGYRAISAVRLLACYLHAGAWRDAESPAADMAPTLGGTASTRTLNLLHRTTRDTTTLRAAPSSLREVLHHLASVTQEDPYDL
ncbi:helix-turn-helix transcriptional regulator [Streptomyces thermolilacinus]|uniref:helix-turn-helix transcriptional regulator n=1 Tax=Streptomyces thermolilacinus TaxID=285540 RepID=UPI0033FF4202